MNIKDKQAFKRKMMNRDEKEMQKFKMDIAKKTINELQVITAYVLQSEFGFGKKRLTRFLTMFHKVYSAIAHGDIRITTLADEVNDKTGLYYDIEKMEWHD